MKTFTKTLSMILIAVMCFSMLATSAFAMDFSLDGGSNDSIDFSLGGDSITPSFAESVDDSFTPSFVESVDDSFTLTAGGSNDFDVSVAQPQAQDDSGFSIDSPAAEQAQQPAVEEQKAEDGDFVLSNDAVFNGDYVEEMKFSSTPNAIKVTDSDTAANVTITNTGSGTFAADTFKGGLFYAYEDGTGKTAKDLPANAREWNGASLVIRGSWLKAQPLGTYYFFGQPLGKPIVPLGFVSVDPGDPTAYGTFTVAPTSYTKYATPEPALIQITASADFTPFTAYGAVPQGSSKGYSCTDYTISGKVMTLGKNFLLSLPDGNYDFYGKTASESIKLGSFTIKSANGGYPAEKWTLWPDYSVPWTSGDDPLMFRSNLMALRTTYPRYTIVPRYGVGAGSTPNNMIDVNQFWDMGDGVFALGTNFLRSLPAGTYTLQVVDYKHLADCTNVVTFKIGSTLRPIDTDKHVIGSIKNLRFLCDEPVYEVYVGNIPLTYGEDYALSNGNKTITLSFEFLNKRSAGNTYTIKALTASGTYPSSTFQILSTAQGSASPRTGDESNLGLWAAFLLLSGTAVVVLVPKLRKHDF